MLIRQSIPVHSSAEPSGNHACYGDMHDIYPKLLLHFLSQAVFVIAAHQNRSSKHGIKHGPKNWD